MSLLEAATEMLCQIVGCDTLEQAREEIARIGVGESKLELWLQVIEREMGNERARARQNEL